MAPTGKSPTMNADPRALITEAEANLSFGAISHKSNSSSFAATLRDGDPISIVDYKSEDAALELPTDLPFREPGGAPPRPSMLSMSHPCMRFLLFVLTAICGSMIPLLTDFSKEFQDSYTDEAGVLHSCDGLRGHSKQCSGYFAYFPTFQIFMEKCSTCTTSLLITLIFSGTNGVRKVVSPERLKLIAPIALFAAGGDLAAILAIGATSASFFLVIGQTRLIATALLSLFVLGKNQTSVQWMLLCILTIACVLYCDLDLYLVKGGGGGKVEMELTGVGFALLKTVLGAGNAVLTERAFKAAPEEPIWVNQAQLGLVSIPVAFAFFWMKAMWLCEEGHCVQDFEGGALTGWTWRVNLLIGGQIFNAFVLGLVYKYVDAVVKYLAYAQSLWVTYIINIAMLGVAFYFDLFLVIIVLVLVVIAYALSKQPDKKAALQARRPTFTEVEQGSANGNPSVEMPKRDSSPK